MAFNNLSDVNNLSDAELVFAIQNGENELYKELLRRYEKTINILISQFLSYDIGEEREDLYQECLISLYSATLVFDNSSSFSTFSQVCMKRALLSLIRRNSRKKDIPRQLLSSIDEIDVPTVFNPEDDFINKENYFDFSKKIRDVLSGFEYNVLSLYLMYFDYSTVAKILSVSVKTVNNALTRARTKIKRIEH